MNPDGRYLGLTLRDVIDICEQLRVDNARLRGNETLYKVNISALEQEVADLKRAMDEHRANDAMKLTRAMGTIAHLIRGG